MSLVSVVIPTFNYAEFLPEAVKSVLEQDHSDLELIVVDDGSTDNTQEVLGGIVDPRMRVLTQSNSGIGAARNTGITNARGEFLAFLDADDLWRSDKLTRAMAFFNQLRIESIYFSMMQEFIHESLKTDTLNIPKVRLAKGLYASSCVIKVADFKRIGAFDPSLHSGEFIDWFLKAQNQGMTFYVDPEVLVFRRIHGFNRDRARRESSKEYARIILKQLQSRRGTD